MRHAASKAPHQPGGRPELSGATLALTLALTVLAGCSGDTGSNSEATMNTDLSAGWLDLTNWALPPHDVDRVLTTVVDVDSPCILADAVGAIENGNPAAFANYSGEFFVLREGPHRVCSWGMVDEQTPSQKCRPVETLVEVIAGARVAWDVRLDCDPLSDPASGHRYAVTRPVTSFHEAAEAAEALGGYLVAIGSEEEQALLAEHFPIWTWIGLRDPELDGSYEWVNGEPLSFTAWCSDPPFQWDADYWVAARLRSSNSCWRPEDFGPEIGLVELEP